MQLSEIMLFKQLLDRRDTSSVHLSSHDSESQSISQRGLIYSTLHYLGSNNSHKAKKNKHSILSLGFMRPPAETFLSLQLSLCPTDLFGASGSKPLKPQRSLPGTPVSTTHFPIDLRTSMEEKYKEIAEVREMTLLHTN